MKRDNKIILNTKYPYPELLGALNIELDIDTYKNLNFKKLPFLVEHVSFLPLYTYAKCPICNFVVRSRADTYSLSLGWQASYGHPILQTSLYVTQYNQKLFETVILKTINQPDFPHCRHFVATQTFVQLHGMQPDFYTWHSCEFVYLIHDFLPEDIPSYAVLHGLPICAIVDNQFQPTYTVFSMTYFSDNRHEMFSRWWKKQRDSNMDYPSFIWEADEKNTDLNSWTSKGRLGWLDVSNDSLPLKIGHGLSLPEYYQQINLLAERYWWSKGIKKNL